MSTVIDGLDYGPLALLVGEWKGDRGLDVSPDKEEADGIERNPYYETISFEAIGDAENASSQILAVVRYHQKVYRKSNDKQFHDQIGYWTWDSKTGVITHSVNIPRAVAIVAGGEATQDGEKTILQVDASLTKDDFTIAQSDFMYQNAKSTAFSMTVTVDANTMSYRESTMLDIYANREFDHRDKSNLVRVK